MKAFVILKSNITKSPLAKVLLRPAGQQCIQVPPEFAYVQMVVTGVPFVISDFAQINCN